MRRQGGLDLRLQWLSAEVNHLERLDRIRAPGGPDGALRHQRSRGRATTRRR
jgi:hypothetical protein